MGEWFNVCGCVGYGERGPITTPIKIPAPKIRVRVGRLGFRTKRDTDVRAYRHLWWRFWLRRRDYDPYKEWTEIFGTPDSEHVEALKGYFGREEEVRVHKF